jgi:glyoxylase-like metal-dependent hydrolase (beta-lactamase superfamily II)
MKAFIFEELMGDGACHTYLVASPRTREALLIDPVLEHVPDYLELLEREGLTLTQVVDTHTHEGHRSGGAELARATGCVHTPSLSHASPRLEHEDSAGGTIPHHAV